MSTCVLRKEDSLVSRRQWLLIWGSGSQKEKGRGGVGTHELGPLTYQACLGGVYHFFVKRDKDLKDWSELRCVS